MNAEAESIKQRREQDRLAAADRPMSADEESRLAVERMAMQVRHFSPTYLMIYKKTFRM